MKILYVCNNAYIPGNGISTSAKNIVSKLKELGEDVRLLSCENPDPDGPQPDYPLKKFYFPLFQPIIDANGFCYASIDRKKVRKAVAWADVVHIEEPLFLEKAAIREAERQGKPVTGTFHLYTQNILSEIPLSNSRLSNHLLMLDWRDNFYNRCTDIQCPTTTVKDLLEKYGFKSRLHVISNGINIPEEPVKVREPQTDPVLLLSIARFAAVKNQPLLMEAMKYSRHAHRIQLYFAGKGAFEVQYRRIAEKLYSSGILKYKPVFAFHDTAELKELASKAYLYIHTANLEVEGLGCVEAIREGAVPLIGKGKHIATSDFALDERSVYDVHSPQELAEKIDWWIEHPEERNEMSRRYAEHARDYDIKASAQALVEMYSRACSGF